MKRLSYIAAVLCCLQLLASCGSKKSATGTDYKPTPEMKSEFGSLAGSYRTWTDVSMPVKFELQEPKRLSISGKASMVHGKSVYLSLRILGMEVGSVYVDNDSVYVIAKVQRMAYAESLGYFRRNFGFTLDDIQSLLLGRAFVPGKGTVTAASEREFTIANVGKDGEWTLTPKKTPKNVSWHFAASRAADGLTSIINALIVSPKSMKPLTAEFSDQKETDAGIAASKVSMAASVKDKNLKLNLVWNLGRAEWNKDIKPSYPKIPSDYRRITTQGLIDLMKKL